MRSISSAFKQWKNLAGVQKGLGEMNNAEQSVSGK